MEHFSNDLNKNLFAQSIITPRQPLGMSLKKVMLDMLGCFHRTSFVPDFATSNFFPLCNVNICQSVKENALFGGCGLIVFYALQV